jgi:hypothetical protein
MRPVAAVRQLLDNNVALFPEKIKSGFAKIFDSLISEKPPKGTMPIHSNNFVTSSTLAGFRRDEGKSAYMTINDNTLRISHHATTAETFFEYDESDDNIISIVVEKPSGKRFKLDDFANNEYAMHKDIAVKEITPAVRGITGKNNLANPPVQVFDIKIQQLIDFVKQNFQNDPLFTENVLAIFAERLDQTYLSAVNRGNMKTAQKMVENAEKSKTRNSNTMTL